MIYDTSSEQKLIGKKIPTNVIQHNLRIAKQCLCYISDNLVTQLEHYNNQRTNQDDYDENLSQLRLEREYYEVSASLLEKTLALIKDLEINTWCVDEDNSSTPVTKQDNSADQGERGFRAAVVDLMVVSIQCWEHCTGKNKLALAEESKLWRITVDNGQLRVRTMDRYLSINTLPNMPRWKVVLATAYFVIDHSNLQLGIHSKLEEAIEKLLEILRKRALL